MAINTYRPNPVSQTITDGVKNSCPSEDAVFNALASISGGVSDGDKGDITVSSSGTVWNIDASTVGVTELSATGTPSATTFLRGDNTWSTPASVDPAGWTTIVKSANQDVTNSATLVDDTDLQFSVVAGGHYMLDMDLVTSANDSTGDYKFAFTVSSGTIDGWGTMQSLTTASSITNVLVSASSSVSTSSLSIGAAADLNRIFYTRLNFAFYASANATFSFQFANNTAALGRISRTWKGSILKYKRLD